MEIEIIKYLKNPLLLFFIYPKTVKKYYFENKFKLDIEYIAKSLNIFDNKQIDIIACHFDFDINLLNNIIKYLKVSNNFIRKYILYVDKYLLYTYQRISPKLLKELIQYIDFDIFFIYNKWILNIHFLSSNPTIVPLLNWCKISGMKSKYINSTFIQKYYKHINFDILITHGNIDEITVRNIPPEYINFHLLAQHQQLSKKFIYQYIDKFPIKEILFTNQESLNSFDRKILSFYY